MNTFNRKEAKSLAKKSLRRNYVILVFACLLAAFFGIANEGSLSMLTAMTRDKEDVENTTSIGSEQNNIIYDLARGNIGIRIKDDEVDLSPARKKDVSFIERFRRARKTEEDKSKYDQRDSIIDGNADEIRKLIEREKNRE